MVPRETLEYTTKRMTPLRTRPVKIRTWIAIVVLLSTLLVCGAWPQSQPQTPANSTTVDNLGLEVQDQSNDQGNDQNHDQPQTATSQTPAGEGARATPETTISSKEAKELF